MDILSFGTPFGLAFASGLNAYLPLLAFSISVRWLHLYKVNPNMAFITQNWFIAALVILTILDFVADKIPLIDHVWDAIHTIVRPIAGAVVAYASSQYLPGSSLPHVNLLPVSGTVFAALSSTIPVTGVVLLVIVLIGGGLAALSHTAKSTTRLVSTVTTLGFLNIGLSVLEDVLVVIFILLSLFASTIMFILLILLVLFLVPRLIRARNMFRRKRERLLP
jgi:Domain of unknown function (DUF4126)